MITTIPKFDLITMGRSSIDLYANDIGIPFVEIKSFASYVGGSPTNIAVGARRLGLDVALLTAVGSDPVGDFILHFLEQEQVNIQYIPRKPLARSSAVILGIEQSGKVPLVFYRNNAADLLINIDDVLATPIASAKAFAFVGTNLAQDPLRSATIFAIEQARIAGCTVFCDLDFRADQWHDPRAFGVAIRSILPLVDVALGTEEEILAAMLTDPAQIHIEDSQISAPEIRGDLNIAIHGLLARGPQALVVKRSAQGCSIFLREGQVLNVPGFPVKVLNVLGAGDAFASGFIYGRIRGWDWIKSARMGNACGAIVVTRHGCANFMGYEDEVLQFIKEKGGF